MAEETKGQLPKYKGSLDVAAWEKIDRNGKTYLSVSIANHVNLFEVEPKIESAQS